MSLLDIPYYLWPVVLVLLFVVVLFCIPWALALTVYLLGMGAIAYYRYFHRDMEEEEVLMAATKFLSRAWLAIGRVWFDYSVNGLEKIPDTGPAVLLFYHGAIPIDYSFLLPQIFMERGRRMRSVFDRHFFFGGIFARPLRTFLKMLQATPGSRQSCLEILESGHILGLSPGGVFEAQFGGPGYDLLWRERTGFADLIKNSNGCPVFLVFTSGIQEAFRTVTLSKRASMRLYEWTKLPLVPFFGGFPVRLRTFVEGPLIFDESCSVEEVRSVCMEKMRRLIVERQERIPGSICRALWQRICNIIIC